MIDVAAVASFHRAQAALLAATYNKAWKHGVKSYLPDPDPEEPEQPRADETQVQLAPVIAAGTVAALVARRERPYQPPLLPFPEHRDRALAPALLGLDRMAGELPAIVPTLEQRQAAEDAIRAGTIEGEDAINYALALAAREWVDSNEWRLTAGESVAWAGEQDGYAQAANEDGQLLEWLPEGDDRVCPDCDELGDMPPMPLEDWPTTPGGDMTICSVGCFAAGTLIEGTVEGGLHARYSGEMVELETASGKRLTITPNHPIATPQGFVPAGTLREGDYVLSANGEVGGRIPPQPEDHGPTRVEDAFSAISQFGAALTRDLRPLDLHGDASLVEGHVDVVVPHRALLNHIIPALTQDHRQRVLISSAAHTTLLASSRRAQQLLLGLSAACCRCPRCSKLTLDPSRRRLDSLPHALPRGTGIQQLYAQDLQAAVGRPQTPVVNATERRQRTIRIGSNERLVSTGRRRGQLAGRPPGRRALALHRCAILLEGRPLEVLRLGPAAKVHAALTEPAGKSRAADAEFIAECLERHPGFVAADYIVKVGHFDSSGHVYDLQSPFGWVLAGGILASNCRCVMQVSDMQLELGDQLPALSEDQEATVDRIAEGRSEQLEPALA